MHVTERFRRLSVGRMEIEITITDPVTYTRPVVFTQPLRLLPDGELIENFCTDNEKLSKTLERVAMPDR